MTAQELAGMREPCVRQGEADEAETLRPDERYSEAEINQCSDFAASRLRVSPLSRPDRALSTIAR